MRSIKSVNQATLRLVKYDKSSEQELSWGTCFRFPHVSYKECNVYATCKHNLSCTEDQSIAIFDIARKQYYQVNRVAIDNTLDLAFLVSHHNVYHGTLKIKELSEGNNYTLAENKLVASCGYGKSYICLDRFGYIYKRNLPFNPTLGEDAFSTSLQLISGDSGAPVLNCYHELIGMHVCRNMATLEQIAMSLPTINKAFVNALEKNPSFLDKDPNHQTYAGVEYPMRLLEVLESKAPKEVLT